MMKRHGPCYLAENAIIVGDVRLSEGVNIWPNCVIRGDVAPLILGKNVNIQDGTIIHADFGFPNEIEEGVVVGHGAILHGQTIGKHTLIGMGATVLGGSTIGEECIIAAGALVTEGTKIPPRSVMMGVPGKIVRQASDEEVKQTKILNARYLEMSEAHLKGLFPDVRKTKDQKGPTPLPSHISFLLSAQRALLTHVTPPLRSVSMNIDEANRQWKIRFVYDGMPSESQLEAARVTVTEIVTDFEDWKFEDEFLFVKTPEKCPTLDWIVYKRCED